MDEETLEPLQIPAVSETPDGFFKIEGQGDAKYPSETEAKAIARRIAVAKRGRKAA